MIKSNIINLTLDTIDYLRKMFNIEASYSKTLKEIDKILVFETLKCNPLKSGFKIQSKDRKMLQSYIDQIHLPMQKTKCGYFYTKSNTIFCSFNN